MRVEDGTGRTIHVSKLPRFTASGGVSGAKEGEEFSGTAHIVI